MALRSTVADETHQRISNIRTHHNQNKVLILKCILRKHEISLFRKLSNTDMNAQIWQIQFRLSWSDASYRILVYLLLFLFFLTMYVKYNRSTIDCNII